MTDIAANGKSYFDFGTGNCGLLSCANRKDTNNRKMKAEWGFLKDLVFINPGEFHRP